MQSRHLLAALCVVSALCALVDATTENLINRSFTFLLWHCHQASEMVELWRQGGGLSLTGEGNFFPLWGATLLLALTDLGFLENDAFYVFRGATIALLTLAGWVSAEALWLRYGRAGWWAGWLVALNPVSLQLIGGVYDAMLSSAWFALAGAALIYAELAPGRPWRWYLTAGGLLGVGFNIRSDMLYPVLGALIVAAIWSRDRARLARLGAVAGLIVLCLAPWTLAQHERWGSWSPTSSNTGHVAYISLGQIEDAPWDIEHIDGFQAEEVLAEITPEWGDRLPEREIAKVYSPPASAAYFRRFREAVSANPGAYLAGALKKGGTILIEKKEGLLVPQRCLEPNPRKLLKRVEVCSDAVVPRPLLTIYLNVGMVLLLGLGVRGLVRGPERSPLTAWPGLIGSALLVLLAGFQYLERHLYSVTGLLALVWIVAGLELARWLYPERSIAAPPEGLEDAA